MKIDGACHCGTITIEGEADPEKTQICHCTDCQTIRLIGFIDSEELSLLRGSPLSVSITAATASSPCRVGAHSS